MLASIAEPTWLQVINLLVVPALGLVGIALRALWRSNQDRICTIESRQQASEARLTTFEEEVRVIQDSKCTVEDFLRETGRLGQKMDLVLQRMDRHEGQDNAVRDLAIAIAKMMEDRHERPSD